MKRSNDLLWLRIALLAGALGVLAAGVGCGQRGPERYRVHGTVTYAGSAVPMGRIVFEPDITRGNRGPQGFAPIEDGRFDTAAKFCQGAVGGPTLVRIEGFGMIEGAEDATSAGRRLFEAYETSVDLPRENVVRTFDVPAAAGR